MVDLHANELRLTPEFSKTNEGRVIPIPPALREVLLRRLAKRRLDCPLVFHKDGKHLGDWRKAWKRACREAGYPHLLFHDLRRTAVRNHDRAGVRPNAAKKLVGHKTDDMYRRYNIESKRDLEEAGKLYAAYMATLPTSDNVVSLRRAAEGGTQ